MTNYTPKKAILLALMLLMSALTAHMMIAGFVGASDADEGAEFEHEDIDDLDEDEFEDDEYTDFEDLEFWDMDDMDFNETVEIQWELESLEEFAAELEEEGVDVSELKDKIAEIEALSSKDMTEDEMDEVWELLDEAWDAVEWEAFEWEYEEEELTDEELRSFYAEEKLELDSELQDLIERTDELGVVLGNITVILNFEPTELSEEEREELDSLFMDAWILVAEDAYDDYAEWEFDNETLIDIYRENIEYAEEYLEELEDEGTDISEHEEALAQIEDLIDEAEENIDTPEVFDELTAQIDELLAEVYEFEDCPDCFMEDEYDFTSEELLGWYEEDLEYLKEVAEELANAGLDNSKIVSAIEEIQTLVDQAKSELPAIKDETIDEIESVLEDAFDSVEWDELFDDQYIIDGSIEELAEMYASNLESLRALKEDLEAQNVDTEDLDDLIQDYAETLSEAVESDDFEEYVDDLDDILDEAWESIEWEEYELEEVTSTV